MIWFVTIGTGSGICLTLLVLAAFGNVLTGFPERILSIVGVSLVFIGIYKDINK